MDMIRDELEVNEAEEERFRNGSNTLRFWIFLRNMITVKKYCILSLMLSLILAVQLIALFPPDLIKVAMARGVLEMAHQMEKGGNETGDGRALN